ncbi:thioredoxin family protein [Christiangramia sabulilitoris]|uniref:Thioredoxin family protein n=1 Tax=Christiangramia sabulilitoris TaxID=2583991 RepID=A0A550HZ83_9FLAO|nr:thioredoxin family protein [Christiangramia sabulilitoris]TRO64027.1 thioredoxin family protein [Christiangramia sabulilitoris]
MNKFLIFFVAIALSCGNNVNKSKDLSENKKDLKTETVQKDMLLGDFSKEELQQKPFSNWFQPAYEDFSPNSEAMATIRENIDDYEIKVLMGTWCGDSKREVPKFLKLLDEANYDYQKLELVAVDRNKTTPNKVEEELEVHRVPTIIFYKDGKEVNRFVEYPQGQSIEEDIAKIVSGKEYKNSYAD